jgi:hypothetical protein
MRRFALGLASLALLSGCGGGGGANPSAMPTPPPLEMVSDSYNPRVGLYEGVGSLADGTSVRWEMVGGADALLSGRVQVGAAWGFQPRDRLFYDLKNGTLALGGSYVVALANGASMRFPGGVPVQSNDGSKPFAFGNVTAFYRRMASGPEERVDLRVTRKNQVLGSEDRLTLTDRSADCNASTATASFSYLETTHEVPDAKLGFFSAHGQLTQSDVSRRFFLRMDDLKTQQLSGNVVIGNGPHFPAVVGSNPVQFSYYEDTPDGAIRQWDAVSGSVIFDAIDATSPVNNPLLGETYQTTGKVSFHTANLRMEPSNSTTDPRFAGAKGSFTLNYAGTSTVGYKRYSRNW